MTESAALRRYTFKLYPSKTQDAALREQARMCAMLWNVLLAERERFGVDKNTGAKVEFDIDRADIDASFAEIDARSPLYEGSETKRKFSEEDRKLRRALFDEIRNRRMERRKSLNVRSLSAFCQGKTITKMRAESAEWRDIPRGTQERVAGMLDLAMKAFFRRAKSGAGAQSGYPRFKRVRDADSVPMREPAKSCWKFESLADSRPAGNSEPDGSELSRARGEEGPMARVRTEQCSWRLTLHGIPGAIKARGKFPIEPMSLKTADVKFYDGSWWLSVCVKMALRRSAGHEKLRVDLDLIDSFASVKLANGRCVPGLTPPFSSAAEGEFPSIVTAQQGVPCGEPANAGEAQGACRRPCRSPACGEPANAGEAQGHDFLLALATPCGEPANAGEAQASQERDIRLATCGEPANAGEAQVITQLRPVNRTCGEPANAGEAQEGGCGGQDSATCGDPGEAQGVIMPGGDATDVLQSSRDKRFKRGSIRWLREKRRIARMKARQACRTREALHRWTTAIIAAASELTVVAPPVKEMTRTGRGNERFHGAKVETIAAINRHVLSMAPSSAIQMIEYKAAEAGVACTVERRADHQTSIGGDLRAAAIDARRAKRAVKRKQRFLEAAE